MSNLSIGRLCFALLFSNIFPINAAAAKKICLKSFVFTQL